MGTSQMVTKSWNAQPDGRPGGPRKAREGPEDPGRPGRPGKARKTRGGPEAPEDPGKARKPRKTREAPGRPGSLGGPRKAPEGPGKPRRAPEGPGRPRGGPEAPEDPGKARKAPESLGSLGGPRRARESPGGPRAAKDPARKPERPCRAVCPEGGRPAEGRRRDCRCTACGGQASPLFPTPPQAGCGQGGCGLAPVQGRLSASLKQVPGCLKGRCPATWVHERAEIAPNRAQRQRPAASGRSRGDCPQVQGQNTAAGRFFWSVNVTFCVFSTRTDCRRPFSGAGAGRASGGVVPTVPAAA